jgi:16S rRNA processing protein RimM
MPADEGAGATSPDHLVVGHISRPHGTRGELFVWPLTDRPAELFAAGRALLLGDENGVLHPGAPSVVVEHSRPFKRGLLVAFENVADRVAAESLARRYLLIPAADAPPLEEGEVFYHELLGCAVETVEGRSVGAVTEVFETEPHHLLQVRGPDGRDRLVPFAERIVRDIDTAARRIVIDPPDGLLDL